MNPATPASGSQPLSSALLPESGNGNRISITSDSPQASPSGYTARPEVVASTPGGAPPPMASRLPASTILGDLVGSLLDRIAGWLSPNFVERSLGLARDVGHYAILGGTGLTLLYAIYAAIKFNSFALCMTGVGFIVALAVAQFAAVRFLSAGTRTIANTPSQVSSPAFLECTGLLLLLAAVASLAGGVVTSIRVESIIPLLPALFFTITFTYLSATALHPTLANVNLGVGSAGEEGVGLLSFFFKASLKLVPLFFALLAVAGDLAILASFTESGQGFASTVGSVLQFVPLPLDTSAGFTGSAVVMLAALLPMLGYFAFLLSYLMIDLVRAVLSLPLKLDALRR